MALAPDLAGRTFPPTAPYVVTDERVAEFAAASGTPWTGGAAPATFPIVVAFQAMLALMADPFGNGFCLVEFLGRGYDEIVDKP